AASERSAGKRLGDALRDASGAFKWYCKEPLSEEFANLKVEDGSTFDPKGLACVFTAVESDAAKLIEPRLAALVPVVSTASAFRYEEDVPIFIPGVNLEQVALIDVQRKKRGWKGFVTPVPNCTTMGLAMSLAPIYRTFGCKRVFMTSMQAVSG